MITITKKQAELAVEIITKAALENVDVAESSEELLNTLSEQIENT